MNQSFSKFTYFTVLESAFTDVYYHQKHAEYFLLYF